jgi:hypothetical protein
MILVRNTFHADFGKGPELAAQLSAAMTDLVKDVGSGSSWRVLVGITGSTDTVVVEVTEASLAAWETRQAELMKQADFAKAFGEAAALIDSAGTVEFLTVVGPS